MPMYEYACDSCGKQFEIEQKMSDAPLKDCPECKGAVKRLISQGNFILKGGGWHSEGYGSTAAKPAGGECGSKPACEGCPAAAGK